MAEGERFPASGDMTSECQAGALSAVTTTKLSHITIYSCHVSAFYNAAGDKLLQSGTARESGIPATEFL